MIDYFLFKIVLSMINDHCKVFSVIMPFIAVLFGKLAMYK